MEGNVSERQKIWDEFLEAWPLEKLSEMSLDEYTSTNSGDSFCYWLEKKTEGIGSIWGGSAFKFGVYRRLSKEKKENNKGRCFSDDFGWLEKYGKTPKEAYKKVHGLIVKVAHAARAGDLHAVEEIDFGSTVKWKIAFLYQDQASASILPIFKSEYLSLLLNAPIKSIPDAHVQIMHEHPQKNVLELGSYLFEEVQELLEKQATPEKAKSYLDNQSEFSLIKPPTKYIAGYETDDGLQLALTMTGNKVVIYLEPRLSESFIEAQNLQTESYPASRSRNSNISSNTPHLAPGNPMLKITVPSIEQFEKICDEYLNQGSESTSNIGANTPMENNNEKVKSAPLNQIIYGPPGTGKTYSTTEEAVRITEPTWYDETRSSITNGQQFRDALKEKYDSLVEQGRIAFTTFHQSFSYEDFVEGIRAITDEDSGTIRYEVVDGVFKQLCTSATVEVQNKADESISLNGRRVWKMSLGDTQGNEEHIFDECLDSNYVLLGWGQDIDFSGCRNRQEVKSRLETHFEKAIDKNNYEITSVNQFKNEIKIGDLVVVSDGNHKFRAIAEVTGDYEFLSTEDRVGYQQLRRVKWLRQYSPSLPRERLFKKALSQMTLYQLRPKTIDMSKLSALLSQPGAKDGEHRPHVLIIDEINRGNLSRIFGELITLIEPDKRKCGEDQRTAILPYSKEPFSVPDNLFIIGTMNTADKSLAQIDLALRRRFEFIELLPKPQLLGDLTVFNTKVSDILDVINQRIEVLLDRDHLIGHSHFFALIGLTSATEKEELLGTIFEKRIIPLLQEYFFSDWERISWVLNDIDKPPVAQFIQLENTGIPVGSLFSSRVVEEISDRRYRINNEAFSNPEAYRRILPTSMAM